MNGEKIMQIFLPFQRKIAEENLKFVPFCPIIMSFVAQPEYKIHIVFFSDLEPHNTKSSTKAFVQHFNEISTV